MKLPLLVGRGLPILVMLLGIVRSPSPGIVPKIPCQRIFVPSDPGVPRTFVVDCRPVMFCGEKLQTKMQNYIEYFLLLIFTFGSAKTEKVKKRNKLWQN